MEPAEQDDWLPLRTEFDKVWRGWHPGQVQAYLERIESDVQTLVTDRDAAAAQAEDLSEQLTDARVRIMALQGDLDRFCRQPVDPEALDELLRRKVELAERAADDIMAGARTAAERGWLHAQAVAERVKECYEQLLAQAEQQQRAAEAAYRAVLERTQNEVRSCSVTPRSSAGRWTRRPNSGVGWWRSSSRN